jgi:23S rRNA (guanosine2251-2'-O)-methyltransferase
MKKLKTTELNRKNLEEYKQAAKLQLVVVLDNLRSMYNVGSIFRTADAFLVKKIILCGITPQPPHREIHKTALGSTESVEWIYYKEIADAVGDLKKQGFQIIGVEQTDETLPLNDFTVDTPGKYALVLGNEINGISDEVMPLLDLCLEIPQYGTKHSLNVSVVAGIVIHYIAGLLIKD